MEAPRTALSKSAPNSRPGTPDVDDDDNNVSMKEGDCYIRLSFRKGGDKAFYAALKTAIQEKAWQVKTSFIMENPIPDVSQGYKDNQTTSI